MLQQGKFGGNSMAPYGLALAAILASIPNFAREEKLRDPSFTRFVRPNVQIDQDTANHHGRGLPGARKVHKS